MSENGIRAFCCILLQLLTFMPVTKRQDVLRSAYRALAYCVPNHFVYLIDFIRELDHFAFSKLLYLFIFLYIMLYNLVIAVKKLLSNYSSAPIDHSLLENGRSNCVYKSKRTVTVRRHICCTKCAL